MPLIYLHAEGKQTGCLPCRVQLSVQAAHDFRQPFEEICIIATEAQRRTDLQAVAKATSHANQHALKLRSSVAQLFVELRIRLSAVWPGELDGVEQSGAANVGDGREILGQLAQSGTQIVPVALGVVLVGLLFNHLQYREAHGGSHRVTAKGVEVLGLFAERLPESPDLVITAAMGKPFPIGLPSVTISGCTL